MSMKYRLSVMDANVPEDPVMARIRAWLESSGISQHELGVKMGYSEDVARKAVWQFLRSKDPRLSTLRKFAAAAGVPVAELLAEKKGRMK
jgi:transcriptional regulator with XRE-family HTH domain